MQRRVLQFESNFHVLAGNSRSQAALMVLTDGESTGGPNNRHRDSDQWLFVVSGQGKAIIEQQTYELVPYTLLLIERGEAHEICNTGSALLQTINFYVPPAYDQDEGRPPERD